MPSYGPYSVAYARRTGRPVKFAGIKRGYAAKKRYQKRTYKAGPQKLQLVKAVGIDQLIPHRKWCNFNYEFTQVLTKANNVTCNFIHCRLNSIYDVEYENGGKNQPCNGYAKAAALYNSYKVYRAKVLVQFENNCAVPVPVAVYPLNDITSTTSSMRVTDLATRFGGKSTMLGYLGKPNQSLYMNLDVKKQYGISKLTFSDSLFGAAMGATPSNKLYLVIALGEIGDGATVQTSVVLRVRIAMQCVLMDPIEATDQ